MIESFHIKNFKGLTDLELPLTRLTLLGGRNNVGKSTVLEALFAFHDRFNPQLLVRSAVWRGMGALLGALVDPDLLWSPSFANYDLSKPIELAARIDDATQTVTIKYLPNHPISLQTNQGIAGGAIITGQTDQPSTPAATLQLTYNVGGKDLLRTHTSILNGQLTYNVDLSEASTAPRIGLLNLRAHESEAVMAQGYGQLDIYGRQDTVLRFVNLLDPRIKALSVVAIGNVPVIHADVGMGRKLPAAYLGDGVHRLLSIIIYMAITENSMLMIDEIDSGLHYSVLPKVWQAIAEASHEFGCQVIGTTHNYECLVTANEALGGKHESDFSFIRMDRRGGVVVPKVYDFELFAEALKSNLELR